MKSKRFLCLLLVLLMVFSLTPSETRAETTVYFTAVNDQLLPDLSDETMPFWSGGRLYVPSTVITGTDLGLFYSRSRDKSTAVVYRQGSALTFNFAAGTVADQNDRQYSGPAIVRSDVVFLPLDLLTQFFSLDYSYTRVTYGYLVRVKSDTVVLSDAKFIDAAAMSMEQRYNEYMKTHSDSNDPGNTPDQNTDGDRDLVCLALRVTDEESANVLLDTLASDNATATFLFSEEQLSSSGDLLRRVVISGNAAALRIDASGGSARTLSAIERSNSALWAACNEKTRRSTARRTRRCAPCAPRATAPLTLTWITAAVFPPRRRPPAASRVRPAPAAAPPILAPTPPCRKTGARCSPAFARPRASSRRSTSSRSQRTRDGFTNCSGNTHSFAYNKQ